MLLSVSDGNKKARGIGNVDAGRRNLSKVNSLRSPHPYSCVSVCIIYLEEFSKNEKLANSLS
jgi:hypothetical protein